MGVGGCKWVGVGEWMWVGVNVGELMCGCGCEWM